MEKYDSRDETVAHIDRVHSLIDGVVGDLELRAQLHDYSKLRHPEKETFDRVTPLLKEYTYGSDEYKDTLSSMKVALDHHYKVNRHHPEHFENGIKDMNLVDLLEMLLDWKAASERHDDGDIRKSIEHNAGRFGYGVEIEQLLLNTLDYLKL